MEFASFGSFRAQNNNTSNVETSGLLSSNQNNTETSGSLALLAPEVGPGYDTYTSSNPFAPSIDYSQYSSSESAETAGSLADAGGYCDFSSGASFGGDCGGAASFSGGGDCGGCSSFVG